MNRHYKARVSVPCYRSTPELVSRERSVSEARGAVESFSTLLSCSYKFLSYKIRQTLSSQIKVKTSKFIQGKNGIKRLTSG